MGPNVACERNRDVVSEELKVGSVTAGGGGGGGGAGEIGVWPDPESLPPPPLQAAKTKADAIMPRNLIAIDILPVRAS